MALRFRTQKGHRNSRVVVGVAIGREFLQYATIEAADSEPGSLSVDESQNAVWTHFCTPPEWDTGRIYECLLRNYR